MQASENSLTDKAIILPPSTDSAEGGSLLGRQQLTLIGANGSGKSLFMDEMVRLNGDRAYRISALSAFYAPIEESMMPGSVDSRYRAAAREQSYLRADAVSELDKVIYILFADELESLIEMKREFRQSGKKPKVRSTMLDKLERHWERLFPGNRIIRERGRLMFSTASGKDLITANSLSQGEKGVLYYLGAALLAPRGAVIFVDSPTLFVHPSILGSLWNTIEELRGDCSFVYNSVDEDFIGSRTRNTCIWVKRYDSGAGRWDYDMLEPGDGVDRLLMEFGGSRRPVLFIEGDRSHSIDMRLYSLVFPDMMVKPLGSCDKVIETTRSLNDQQSILHMKSVGIVDRDRRTDKEVEYLRRKHVMVPEVAEIENIFLLPEVIRLMARRRGRDEKKIERRVRQEILRMFKRHSEEQALQHVRHKVKRDVECKIDARFNCITALETHIKSLLTRLEPRRQYNELRGRFAAMIRDGDYEGVLKVFNHKPALPDSGVAQLLGFKSKEDYIAGVLETLKSQGKESETLRAVIRHCLRWEEETGGTGPEQTERNRKKPTDYNIT